MTRLTDIAVTNRSVTRELSTDRARPRRRQYAPISPVSRVRDWVCGRLGQLFFRVPKFLR
jgi:hypothetical protein